MSTTMEHTEDPVVDLREPPMFSIPSETPAPEPERDQAESLRRRRRVLVIALVAVVVALVAQQLLGMVMAGQRQRHLAYDVTVPDPRITAGKAYFLLQIPDIGLNKVVAEGASSSELRGGPGHVIGTAGLAKGGNVVVLGRRLRFGADFDRLGELAAGSKVYAQSRGGGVTRVYTVESVKRVSDSDPRPLRATADRLTLITSGSGLVPDTRLVVVAKADAPSPLAPKAKATADTVKIDIRALDERPIGAFELVLSMLLLVLAVIGTVIGVRRLDQSYSRASVFQAVLPIVVLLVICVVIIGDSALPATL